MYWTVARIRLENISKRFGQTVALDSVSLEIRDGELFAVLGPSGCGKTTLLRVIAGFEAPDEGHVYFDDEDVTHVPPDRRGAVMVFQNWALWPHMTVFDNVAYGLRVRRLPASEIRERVMKVLDMLGLRGLENRYPHQLSGGQQQRVALARALVVEPRVLLLDEPLSNLDARLRLRLRGEIRRLQKELGVTTVYVTHDQEEALAVADRIAVMRRGRVVEVGEPREIYWSPRSPFTAFFIGKTSVAYGRVVDADGGYAYVQIGEMRVKAINHGLKPGDEGVVVFKAEHAKPKPPEGQEYNEITGKVVVSMYLGGMVELRITPPGYSRDIAFYMPGDVNAEPGTVVKIYLPVSAVHAYRVEDEELAREILEQD